MKRIAFLVSGGDAPGINACLAGIATTAEHRGLQALAVPNGFDGLIDGHFEEIFVPWLRTASYGGSPIPTARSARFRQVDSQRLAVGQLRQRGIEGLIVLGGDGSAHAAMALVELGVPSVCVPVTIDNDLWGTDYTLGFDTGVQQIRDILLDIQETANAYRGRVFFVETLGGPAGHLALAGGLAGGADLILAPELRPTPQAVAERVKALLDSGRDRVVIAITFLAMLELMKRREIVVEQAMPWGPIVARATTAQERTTAGAEAVAADAPFDETLESFA